MLNRRRLIVASLGGVLASGAYLASAGGQELTPTIVPMATPNATPPSSLPEFRGDISDIWDAPWNVEGKLISFRGIVLQRIIAPEGFAIRVNADGDVYRSGLYMRVPREDGTVANLLVVSNDDLEKINDRKTAEIIGTYGGFGRDPIIVARSVEPIDD